MLTFYKKLPKRKGRPQNGSVRSEPYTCHPPPRPLSQLALSLFVQRSARSKRALRHLSSRGGRQTNRLPYFFNLFLGKGVSLGFLLCLSVSGWVGWGEGPGLSKGMWAPKSRPRRIGPGLQPKLPSSPVDPTPPTPPVATTCR